jgi:hypothetical protein
MVARAIVTKIEDERKPREIRTNHIVGYKSPDRIFEENKESGVVPDISAVYNNETIVYEIELEDEMPVDKWQTFSDYAKKHRGSFYLVVPKHKKEAIRHELENSQVNAGLITFNAPAD